MSFFGIHTWPRDSVNFYQNLGQMLINEKREGKSTVGTCNVIQNTRYHHCYKGSFNSCIYVIFFAKSSGFNIFR